MKILSFDVGIKNLAYCIIDYDIDNDKVLVKGSEDGTKRVKFIIKM